jgi:hypothetical protein
MGTFYFQRDENLATKPEVLKIRRATGLSTADVVFHIEEFWRHVNQHGQSLNDGTGRGTLPGYELADLPLLVGLTDHYWSAVVTAGWIQLGSAGELLIPRFDDRFGKLAQARAAATIRQQRSRARRTETRPPTETSPAPLIEQQSSDEDTPTSDTVEPLRLAVRRTTSQFDLLTISDLSVCGRLLCWMADVSALPRPVVINDDWHRLRVIAAGIRATSGVAVKNPMALFKSIVGKQRWTMLEPEDLKTAQARLNTYQHRLVTLQDGQADRAGPDMAPADVAQDLLTAGFGKIPIDAKADGRAALLKWDRDRNARTG